MEKKTHLQGILKNAVSIICIIAFYVLPGNTIKAKAEIINPQVISDVPELDSLHESIYVLWHTAYPNKNYRLIIDLLPKLDISVSKLSESALPKILHSKQTRWDNEIINLQSNLRELHKAAEEDDKGSMLKTVESLHGSYEQLVRILRPALPELENFHEDLYVVYHTYLPGNDFEKIKTAIPSMKMKMGLLMKARLPQSMANHQNEFNQAVSKLEISLNEAETSIETGNKDTIQPAIEKLHSDYVNVSALLQ